MWRAVLWVAAASLTLVQPRELDPAVCGTRFDVQRDKIIRTEESRDMGARYLSELDVGTRHECLRLCCETDSCDVFVYEEKSPGSCYLFNCGPPEDFRCKFTAHGNFSSGVLALSRRLAELQDQERLARREQELASLRGATSTTSTSTTTTSPPAPPPPPPQPPDPPPGRCSRYQFECRRGGECIAVYNACDGVPQCADGSDEAVELGCPASAPAVAVAHAPAAAHVVTISTPTTPLPTPPPAPPLNSMQMQPMQVLGEGVEGESSAVESPGGHWPHRLTQAQPPPQPMRYNSVPEVARAPHIFSHKGGLLQEDAPPYAPFEPWSRRLWPQPGGVPDWGAGWGEADPRRAWPVPPPQREDLQQRDPELPLYAIPKPMPELPPAMMAAPQTLRDAPKKGLMLPPAAAERPAETPRPHTTPAPAPPKDNTTKKKASADAPLAVDPHVMHGSTSSGGNGGELSAALADDERGGLSEHPPAAILLLVLGVAMTVVMGGMVGCRARASRRRLRRGRAPLAHDADYLVNGMYL